MKKIGNNLTEQKREKKLERKQQKRELYTKNRNIGKHERKKYKERVKRTG